MLVRSALQGTSCGSPAGKVAEIAVNYEHFCKIATKPIPIGRKCIRNHLVLLVAYVMMDLMDQR